MSLKNKMISLFLGHIKTRQWFRRRLTRSASTTKAQSASLPKIFDLVSIIQISASKVTQFTTPKANKPKVAESPSAACKMCKDLNQRVSKTPGQTLSSLETIKVWLIWKILTDYIEKVATLPRINPFLIISWGHKRFTTTLEVVNSLRMGRTSTCNLQISLTVRQLLIRI